MQLPKKYNIYLEDKDIKCYFTRRAPYSTGSASYVTSPRWRYRSPEPKQVCIEWCKNSSSLREKRQL